MAKEIKLPAVGITERLKKMIEIFQKENNCAMTVFVAYPEMVKSDVIGAPDKQQIQLKMLDFGIPEQMIPMCLQLHIDYAKQVKERNTKPEEKTAE